MKYNGLTIGVPKEILAGERRVSAVPETVAAFVEQGARVLVEAGAGAGAFSQMRLTDKRGGGNYARCAHNLCPGRSDP